VVEGGCCKLGLEVKAALENCLISQKQLSAKEERSTKNIGGLLPLVLSSQRGVNV
jgi:hypothetical protein